MIFVMCIDYREINKVTIRDNFPLPLIDDCLDFMSGKVWFTLLDLKDGFNQCSMDEASIPYTSFVTPHGQYEYLKMPFGLKNAPSNFQRFVYNIFRDLIDAEKIIVYIDDILIASESFETHINILKEVLERIYETGLELKLKKCKFAYREIDYLGSAQQMHILMLLRSIQFLRIINS